MTTPTTIANHNITVAVADTLQILKPTVAYEYPAPHGPGFICKLTPSVSKALLARMDTRQRKLRSEQVRHLMNEMLGGRWEPPACNTVLIDDLTGLITDGQHRLNALARCPDGITIEQKIELAPARVMLVAGRGELPRSLRDQRMMVYGESPDHTVIAAIAYEARDFSDKAQPDDVVHSLVTSCQFVGELSKISTTGKGRASKAFLAAALRCMRARPAEALVFFTAVRVGLPKPRGEYSDAANALIRRIDEMRINGPLSGSTTSRKVAELSIRAFNAWVTGNDATRLQAKGEIPEVK